MKSGLDYFPLDVHLDSKFELIEAEFGLTGFAVVVKLYQKIYGGFGYYCEWTNEVALLFGRSCGLGGNAVSEIVSASIRRGIFDSDRFEKYQILTSEGIQKRYFEAVSRRKEISVKKQYLFSSVIKKYPNVRISSENVNISTENVYISEQSKEKKSKVEYKEKSVEKKNGLSPGTTKRSVPRKHAYGDYANILLTEQEYTKLHDDYPNADEAISFFSEYVMMKGYKANSHYLAMKKWVFDALKEREIRSREMQEREKRLKGKQTGQRKTKIDKEAVEQLEEAILYGMGEDHP